VLVVSSLSLNAICLLIDVNLLITELDNCVLRTTADLHEDVRLPKATGPVCISPLRYSLSVPYCRSSYLHRCGGSQPLPSEPHAASETGC